MAEPKPQIGSGMQELVITSSNHASLAVPPGGTLAQDDKSAKETIVLKDVSDVVAWLGDSPSLATSHSGPLCLLS